MGLKEYLKGKAKAYKKSFDEEKRFRQLLRKKEKQAERAARLSEASVLARQKMAAKREALLRNYKEKLNKPAPSPVGNLFGFGEQPTQPTRYIKVNPKKKSKKKSQYRNPQPSWNPITGYR